MPINFKTAPNIREVIPASRVNQALTELTSYLASHFDLASGNFALVGIQSRGVILANRIAHVLKRQSHMEVPVGAVDITLYRDDFSSSGINPIIGETHLDFNIDEKHIILIDDVLFTGRTVRAAIDQIMDFGRPKAVTLVVLVDRGHRELPIAADCAPIKVSTQREESVNLHVEELDGKDEIVITEAVSA